MPTQSKPKRHHYVPSFYLKRFADQKGRLKAFDRRSDRTITTSSRAVAVERNFYSLPEDSGLPEALLERVLGAQEAEAASAIRDIVEACQVGAVERECLIVHIALQMLRTRRQRLITKLATEWVATLQAQVWLNRRLQEDEFETESERDVAERSLRQLAAGETKISPEEKSLVGTTLLGFERMVEVLSSDWNWIVVHVNKAIFITSDHPICMLGEPVPGLPSGNIGVANALEIWFPLDPRHALVLSREHEMKSPITGISKGHIRRINLRLALESERWCFFHPRSEGIGRFQIPSEPPSFVEETIDVSDRGDGTMSELVRTGMERPHVANEQLLSGRQLKPFT